MTKKTKNVWTAEHEATMLDMQALIISARKAVEWLLVAQRHECAPEYLQTLMTREYKRKLQQMANVSKWLQKLGGTFLQGKAHEDGEVYSWHGTIEMEGNYYLSLTFGRYHGVDGFDIPLGLEITLNHRRNKKTAARMAVMCDLDTVEDMRDIKYAFKNAVTQVKEQYKINPLYKLTAKESA